MRTVAALFVLLSCAPLGAHDFWIEPSAFQPRAGATITTSLRVGDNFEGERVPRRSERIETFVVRDASGDRPVPGRENRDPAGFVSVARPAVIGYHAKPYPHEISRAKFEQFLREEGIRGVRPKRGVQRERFHRFAKSQIGDAKVAPFGFRYEIVAVSDHVFRVLFEGKPLAGAFVAALSRDGRRMSARSDANGLVTLELGKGVWLIKSVHVLPAPEGADYDWDSLWASLTLER